jgi:hypothetical protein
MEKEAEKEKGKNILWRVMPPKTPIWLVIGFITILQVVTSITFYTVTHLHSLQSVHSDIPILFGASGLSLENCRPLTAWVSPVVFTITPLHGPHGKRSLYCWDVLKPFPSNGRGTDLQKTSYVIAILPAYWGADFCLPTSNNIWNSIVACVYSVARCLPVRCLAIHVTVYIRRRKQGCCFLSIYVLSKCNHSHNNILIHCALHLKWIYTRILRTLTYTIC